MTDNYSTDITWVSLPLPLGLDTDFFIQRIFTAKSTKIQMGWQTCFVGQKRMSYLALALPSLLRSVTSSSEGSLSAQQVKHYILILLSKLMIQTVSLDPDLTPFFNITRAIGVKWTLSSSHPVIYSPSQSDRSLCSVRCRFPKAWSLL